MKTFFKRLFLITLIITNLVLFTACGKKNIYLITLDNSMGGVTTVQIVHSYLSVKEQNKLQNEMSEIVNAIDKIFNVQTDLFISELREVNNNSGKKPVMVSDELIGVLKKALETTKLSQIDGTYMYDPTIGPVWNLWNFIENGYIEGINKEPTIPTKEDIMELIPLINFEDVIIDDINRTVFLKEEGMMLDLGSIVKGYAADKIKEYLLKNNYSSAVINVEGNVLLIGSNYYDNRNQPWKVLLKTPFVSLLDSEYNDIRNFGTLYLEDVTIVTSGVYERYIKKNNEMYHHILNPKTGYPIDNGIISVSVITTKSIVGDTLSTMLFSVGLERALELIKSMADIEAVFIVKDGDNQRIVVTSGLKENFVFNNKLINRGYIYE